MFITALDDIVSTIFAGCMVGMDFVVVVVPFPALVAHTKGDILNTVVGIVGIGDMR